MYGDKGVMKRGMFHSLILGLGQVLGKKSTQKLWVGFVIWIQKISGVVTNGEQLLYSRI